MKKIASLLILSAFIVQNAFAVNSVFTDVPQDAWYAIYIDSLLEAGIVDDGEFFRPADSLIRAELVKMVMTAIDGLKDYTAPANPAFDDVQPGAWYTNYIEGAATLGIVSGYTDIQGNLIGLFGPADTVNRAAAVKMLVEAFDLKATDDTPTRYPDVQEEDWFYDYVSIASQQGVVSGYDNGRFGPADPVTRAQMAKMVVLSMQVAGLTEEMPVPIEEESENEEEADEDTTVPTEESPAEEVLPLATPNLMNISDEPVSAGSNDVFVSKYTFRALYEGFRVETVTIVNDVSGDKLGDQPVGTPSIKNVILRFPDENGLPATATAPLGSDGKARFTGLTFFVPRDKDAFFEVYADLNQFSDLGENLSGDVFRLGIQDINNTDSSFRAVGDISSFVIGYNGSRLSVSSSQAALFTVRKSVPRFSLSDSSQILTGGQNTLISFDVTAHQSGSIAIARLAFDLSLNDGGTAGLGLSDFMLYRGSAYLDNVTIYDATGSQALSPGSGGTLTNGNSLVIVTFNQEEIISQGDASSYSLRASVSNAGNSDSVSTRFAQGDENTPLTGLTAVNQANTGKVYVNGDVTAGIFTGATDFFQSAGNARDIIWSDFSADLHLYPQITGGVIPSDSGSADWTNGHLLKLTGLEYHTIMK